MEITPMLEDTRNITALMLLDDSLTVGLFSGFPEKVAAIRAYREPGQSSYVPWFAIVNDAGQVMARVNAAAVQMVLYRD